MTARTAIRLAILLFSSLALFLLSTWDKRRSLDTVKFIPLRSPQASTIIEENAGLYLYPSESRVSSRPTLLIIPGGGYENISMNHEGIQIADRFSEARMNVAILRYRHGPAHHHPAPLQDAIRAMRMLRFNAAEWGIDTNKVGVVGFSAGGHLASLLGTSSITEDTEQIDEADRMNAHPDFMILVYPVISLIPPDAHAGSVQNLLGDNPSTDLLEHLSTQNRVTSSTPPTFLVHTEEDKAVPASNSLLFYQALRHYGVPAELHIYEQGVHGLGLGPRGLPFSHWSNEALEWLEARHITD